MAFVSYKDKKFVLESDVRKGLTDEEIEELEFQQSVERYQKPFEKYIQKIELTRKRRRNNLPLLRSRRRMWFYYDLYTAIIAIQSPIIMMVEAKDHDIEKSLGPCRATYRRFKREPWEGKQEMQ